MPANQTVTNQITPQQANLMARNAIVGSAVKRTQQIFSTTQDVSSSAVLNIAPRNVGLILGFIVQVSANVAVAGGGTPLTLTPFGSWNLLSQVNYTDLQNNVRINTTGWHIGMLNSARSSRPYLGVQSFDSYPAGFGNYWPTLGSAAASIAAAANSDVDFTYYIPLAYSDDDLRGSVYGGVVNATQNLQLTLNANAVQARTQQGSTDAIYYTADSGTAPASVTVGNYTVTVYQVYYDQLPVGKNGIILPALDISTIYELKNTSVGSVVANQDYPIPYSNFRDFLSTVAVYRNKPATADEFMANSDINYLALESANYTNLFKVGPDIASAWARQVIGTDPPLGVFYIPTRAKPISTVQFGNMNLVFNCADVQANAAFLIGYEDFALQNIIGNAQGLPPS